jgi:hypothetical protein
MLNQEEFKKFTQYAYFIGIKEAAKSVNITIAQAYRICSQRKIKYQKKHT